VEVGWDVGEGRGQPGVGGRTTTAKSSWHLTNNFLPVVYYQSLLLILKYY
jgi:hypothetical protein